MTTGMSAAPMGSTSRKPKAEGQKDHEEKQSDGGGSMIR